MTRCALLLRTSLLLLAAGGCLPQPDAAPAPLRVDGSSTVAPLTQALAARFRATSPAPVEVQVSGTGGGFERFCRGEVALIGASRPISAPEVRTCAAAGVAYVELPVAFDGIAVVVHRDNAWVDALTVEELRRMWAPEAEGRVRRWSDVRPGWPEVPLHLHGPGRRSGTFDFFTKAIVGTEGASRADYGASEDDGVLLRAVVGDPLALAYFSSAHAAAHREALRLVPIDAGSVRTGPVAPSPESITRGTYQPLSRPLFLYVSVAAARRPEVEQFVRFALQHVREVAPQVGYVPLPARAMALAAERFRARQPGSAFGGGGAALGVTLTDLLEARLDPLPAR